MRELYLPKSANVAHDVFVRAAEDPGPIIINIDNPKTLARIKEMLKDMRIEGGHQWRNDS